ncbi:MAG: HAMP domain-containing sensor histidine kinase, partial [Pseudohongiellaceae bacterium]|nr:HAMP domain-containing sensor histidine kinase [Pseudohongiellaceae bacterium]
DFTELLNKMNDELQSPFIKLSITHPAAPEINHSSTSIMEFSPVFEQHIQLDMNQYTWDLHWQFSEQYGAKVNYSMAYLVFFTGLAFTGLVALYVRIILQQKSSIQMQVEQKSSELEQAHHQMIQQGKMAALGGMVAGISHELNTPIGNGLMAASVLESQTKELNDSINTNSLTQTQLRDFMESATESTKVIENNMRKAADLVASFKQVAVDQTSERRRNFNLSVMLQELKTTLQPQLKRTPHRLMIDCPKHLPVQSYPGPLGQVLTNLIMNSLQHAFPNNRQGTISIVVMQVSPDRFTITYTDDGVGIPADIIDKVFDPFFTTQLGSGGTGLGLNIVWNLVTEILGGEISIASPESSGAQFEISLPIIAP